MVSEAYETKTTEASQVDPYEHVSTITDALHLEEEQVCGDFKARMTIRVLGTTNKCYRLIEPQSDHIAICATLMLRWPRCCSIGMREAQWTQFLGIAKTISEVKQQ